MTALLNVEELCFEQRAKHNDGHKVDLHPVRRSVDQPVHDVGPPFQRDALEDGHKGKQEVVEGGHVIVGVLRINTTRGVERALPPKSGVQAAEPTIVHVGL